MMTNRQRYSLFLRQFFSVLAICLFLILLFINSGKFALFHTTSPMILLAALLLFVFVFVWIVSEIWYWVSNEDFEYRDYYWQFRQYWSALGLPTIVLFGLEGSKYLLSDSLKLTPVYYFVGMCLVNLLGLLICLRHRRDVGRTLAQIYLLDFLNQGVGLGLIVINNAGPLAAGMYFISRAMLIGLDFAKIIAVLTMLTLPKQQGWPSLIPWVRWRRDNPSTPDYDRFIRLTFGALMLIGMWFAWHGVSYESFVHFTPVILLLILIFRKQSNTVETEIGTVSLEFLKVARDVDRITDEEYRLAVMEMVAYNTNKLVTGWVENDAIKRDKAERAAKLAKDGPKT
jgi:hypothetical protein